MRLRFGSHPVETSNDDKILFPDSGITKAEVIGYYRDAAELMLPHLEGRCLTIRRFPDGIGKDGFYQQNRPDYFPRFVGSKRLPKAGGGTSVDHIVVDDTAALVYLADQGAIEFHGWLSVIDAPRHPDRVVFDLDPAGHGFRDVIDCARLLRDALDSAGLVPFVMTTGSRGLHVSAPLSGGRSFDEIRTLAASVAASIATRDPARFTTEQRKQARRGRLFIDIGRNAYGQTAVLPYSLRALEHAPVATPLDWSELHRSHIGPRRYDIGNLRRRMAQKEDPFSDYVRHGREPAV